MFLYAEKTLVVTIQNGPLKSQEFPKEISAVELRYSWTIFFAARSSFI